MSAPAKVNFKIYQGSTFSEVLRWESSKKVYKTITSITKAAPAVITSTAHGVPSGWRIKVTDVAGMKEINSSDTYRIATVLSADSIELNDINSSSYTAYTSGGTLEYNEPVDLSGFTARMQIREKIDSATTLLELTTVNNRIIINNTDKTITLTIDAITTAGLTFTTAVYSLELVSSGGVVTPFASGTITLVKEVTR